MHQLLTQLLLHTMLYLKPPRGGDKQRTSAEISSGPRRIGRADSSSPTPGHAPFGAAYLREEVHELTLTLSLSLSVSLTLTLTPTLTPT